MLTLKDYIAKMNFQYIGCMLPDVTGDWRSGVQVHLNQKGSSHKNVFAKSDPSGVYLLTDKLYIPGNEYDGTAVLKFGETEAVNQRFYSYKKGQQPTNLKVQEYIKETGKTLYIYFLEAEESTVKIPGPNGRKISVVQKKFCYRNLEKYLIRDYRQSNGQLPELNPNEQ